MTTHPNFKLMKYNQNMTYHRTGKSIEIYQ